MDTEHDNNHDAVAIDHIKKDMKNAKTIYQLRNFKNYKYRDAFDCYQETSCEFINT